MYEIEVCVWNKICVWNGSMCMKLNICMKCKYVHEIKYVYEIEVCVLALQCTYIFLPTFHLQYTSLKLNELIGTISKVKLRA